MKEIKPDKLEPKPNWWNLFEECTDCKTKMWVQTVLCNHEGEFVFETTCFKCGKAENIELSAKLIASFCFDLDFMDMVKIKNNN